MTREYAQRILRNLELIKAYADGKVIQRLDDGKWIDTEYTEFFDSSEYRVKPEPEVVPFTFMSEFLSAWNYECLTFRGNRLDTYDVVEVNLDGVKLVGEGFLTWRTLANNFTFSDGKPCGKEVVE